MKYVARVLSVIFFPLFIPIYGILLLFRESLFLHYPSQIIYAAYRSVIFFATIIPLCCILFLYLLGVLSDMSLKNGKERTLPYLLTAFSFILCAIVLFRLQLPLYVPALMFSTAISLIVNTIVSFWWKISAHMTGMGGLLGGILCVSYKLFINPSEWIMLIVLACGLVASARLYLKAHTPEQVIAGFFNGIFWTLLIPNLKIGWLFLYFR